MNYSRQFASHAAGTVATAIVTGVLFYALRILLANYLTLETYGLFYAVFSFAAIFQPLLSFGFDPGLTPYVTRYRELHQPERIVTLLLNAFFLQIAAALVFLTAILLSAPYLAESYFGDATATSLLIWMAIHSAVLIFFKTGHQLLNGLQSIGARNAAECARVIGCLACAGLLLYLGYGAWAAAFAYIFGAVAGVGVQAVFALALHPEVVKARPHWDSHAVAEAFRSGKYLSLAFSGLLLFSHLDTLMITALLKDLREVAAYQIAVPTWMIIQSLLVAVSLSFTPMAKTLWLRGEHDRLARGLTEIYHVSVITLLPGGLLMGAFADVIIKTLFKTDVGSAPMAFYVLAVGALPFFTAYFNLHVLAGIGREKSAAVAVMVGLLVNAGLNLALVPAFGVRGAAAGTVLGYAVTAWIGYGATMRSMPARLSSNIMAATLVVTLILDLACRWVRGTAWFQAFPQVVAIGAAGLLYAVALLVLDRMGDGVLFRVLRQVLQRAKRPA